MGREILFYAPNIVGYVRLLLLMVSLCVYDEPTRFIPLYGLSALLDACDGILARKLNQTSAFGAWFDVFIDLISRGALWCFISKTFSHCLSLLCTNSQFEDYDVEKLPGPCGRWGYFLMVIEWTAFVCTHCRGANWKIPDDEFPAICKMVMAKGFKTPTGAYAITGIFVLPIWIYGMTSGFLTGTILLSSLAQYGVLVWLIIGRILGLLVELFFIQQHIKGLLTEDKRST